MSQDQGRCTLILAIQTVLEYMGYGVDYDYLMGISGVGFMFYVQNGESSLDASCEAMRERYLSNVSNALGLGLKLVEGDAALFARDPEQHFYKHLGEKTVKSLHARRPVLAYNCIKGHTWDVVSGFAEGRLLCRSVHNRTSSSGLVELIQPYSPNELWPSRIILVGESQERTSASRLIRQSIEAAAQIGRGFDRGEAGPSVAVPAMLDTWAKALAQEPAGEAAILTHERLRQALIDARASLERYLRWVLVELSNLEQRRTVNAVREYFAKSFRLFLSIDLSLDAMANEETRQRAADTIRAASEFEAKAFDALQDLHEKLAREEHTGD